MPQFHYQALTSGGRTMSGRLDAETHDDAAATLAQMGLSVRALELAPPSPPQTPLGRSEFLLFNQQLAAVALADIPLEQGLRQLASDVQSPRMRAAIASIADELERGTPIDEAMTHHGRALSPLYAAIVRAGVRTGRLGEMLTSFTRHLQFAAETRRILYEALTYPVFVFVLAMAVMGLIFAFVVPEVGMIYEGMEVRLPTLTVLSLSIARNLETIAIVLLALVAAPILVPLAMRSSPTWARLREAALLRVPIFGNLYRRALLARLTDALAILVGSGSDLPTALRSSGEAADSEMVKADCERLAVTIERGGDIHLAGPKTALVSPMIVYTLSVRAQGGELADNLYTLSEMYALQARQAQGVLHALLTPILIVFLGLVVVFIMAAVFAPMISLVQNVSGM